MTEPISANYSVFTSFFSRAGLLVRRFFLRFKDDSNQKTNWINDAYKWIAHNTEYYKYFSKLRDKDIQSIQKFFLENFSIYMTLEDINSSITSINSCCSILPQSSSTRNAPKVALEQIIPQPERYLAAIIIEHLSSPDTPTPGIDTLENPIFSMSKNVLWKVVNAIQKTFLLEPSKQPDKQRIVLKIRNLNRRRDKDDKICDAAIIDPSRWFHDVISSIDKQKLPRQRATLLNYEYHINDTLDIPWNYDDIIELMQYSQIPVRN